MIRKTMKIAEIVKLFPGSIEWFNREHVDYCCGGKSTLEEALKGTTINVEAFVRELNEEMGQNGNRYQKKVDESRYQMSISDLIDVILGTHHVEERIMLGQLDKLINKIFIVHFDHHGDELRKVHRLFADLKKELEEHFVQEEKVVFPLMLQLSKSHKNGELTLERVHELENDHVTVGVLLKQIQQETHDFTPPADACPTYIGTFELLKRLIEDIFMHVFYENTVLFVKVEDAIEA